MQAYRILLFAKLKQFKYLLLNTLSLSELNYIFSMRSLGMLSILLGIFTLPIDKFSSRIFLFSWALFCLLEGKNRRGNSAKVISKQQLILLALPIAQFIYYAIGLLYTQNTPDHFFRLEVKLSLFLFPIIVLSSNYKFTQYNKLNVLHAFLIGNLLASVACIFLALNKTIVFADGNILINHAINSAQSHLSFFTLVGNRTSHFSYTHFSALNHTAYFSMYLVFCIAIAYYMFKIKTKRKQKALYLLSILFFYAIIYLLSSRSGLISLMLLLITLTVVEIVHSKRYILVLCVSGILNLGVYKAMTASRIEANITELKEIQKNDGKFLSTKPAKPYKDARLTIWSSAYSVFKNNMVFGTSLGDKQDLIDQEYIKNDYKKGLKYHFCAHNQYLESMVAGGLISTLMLIAMLLFGFIYAIKNRQLLLGIFIGLMAFNFLTESMMETMSGVVFFSIFYSLLIVSKHDPIKQLQQIARRQ